MSKEKNKKKHASNFIVGFKEFISRGSIIDTAIALVLGVAFKAIVDSFIEYILMPTILLVFGQPTVEDWVTVVNGTSFYIGLFVQAIINFLILAFALYLIIYFIIKRKQYREHLDAENKVEQAPEVVVDNAAETVKLLQEIKEQLANNKENK